MHMTEFNGKHLTETFNIIHLFRDKARKVILLAVVRQIHFSHLKLGFGGCFEPAKQGGLCR